MTALIEKTQQLPAASARDKARFYKVAWDAVDSKYARATSSMRSYSGASFVTTGHSCRTYDWPTAALPGFCVRFDLSPVVHPVESRIRSSFGPVRPGVATAWGAKPVVERSAPGCCGTEALRAA